MDSQAPVCPGQRSRCHSVKTSTQEPQTLTKALLLKASKAQTWKSLVQRSRSRRTHPWKHLPSVFFLVPGFHTLFKAEGWSGRMAEPRRLCGLHWTDFPPFSTLETDPSLQVPLPWKHEAHGDTRRTSSWLHWRRHWVLDSTTEEQRPVG